MAAIRIAGLDPPPAEAAPALRDALRDPNPLLRSWAARALAQGLADREELDPVLADLLNTRVLQVRINVVLAFKSPLYTSAPVVSTSAIKSLTKALRDPDTLVRQEAAIVLRDIGPPAEEAVPALADAVFNQDNMYTVVPHFSVQALGKIHAMPEIAIPCLVRALGRPLFLQPDVPVDSLRRFFDHAELMVPLLIEQLDNPEARTLAALTLGEIGPAAQDAVPALQKAIAYSANERMEDAISQPELAEFRRAVDQAIRSITRSCAPD